MAVDRNPFYPKNFLTIGDTTTKIWCEVKRVTCKTDSTHKSFLCPGSEDLRHNVDEAQRCAADRRRLESNQDIRVLRNKGRRVKAKLCTTHQTKFIKRKYRYVEVWDFLHNHEVPILNIKVADSPLNCLKVTNASCHDI